ncbi:hypothetical protein [Streptomyces sp. NPDC003688]
MENDQQHTPPTVIPAGGVFLPADVCHPLWAALHTQLRQHVGNGGRVRPEIEAALYALRSAGLAHMAASGHIQRTSADAAASSPPELITTEQLAVALGVSTRHARRLARTAGITAAARNTWLSEDARHLVTLYRKATR